MFGGFNFNFIITTTTTTTATIIIIIIGGTCYEYAIIMLIMKIKGEFHSLNASLFFYRKKIMSTNISFYFLISSSNYFVFYCSPLFHNFYYPFAPTNTTISAHY
jgi:hypothetical protein